MARVVPLAGIPACAARPQVTLTQFLGAELTGQDGHQESDPRADEEGQDPRASDGPDLEGNDGPQGR